MLLDFNNTWYEQHEKIPWNILWLQQCTLTPKAQLDSPTLILSTVSIPSRTEKTECCCLHKKQSCSPQCCFELLAWIECVLHLQQLWNKAEVKQNSIQLWCSHCFHYVESLSFSKPSYLYIQQCCAYFDLIECKIWMTEYNLALFFGFYCYYIIVISGFCTSVNGLNLVAWHVISGFCTSVNGLNLVAWHESDEIDVYLLGLTHLANAQMRK